MRFRTLTLAVVGVPLLGLTCCPVSAAFAEPASSAVVKVGGPGTSLRDLQQAVDRVAAAGGGTVDIAAGRYELPAALQLRTGVRLRGVPGATVLVQGPGRKTRLAANVHRGSREITLTDATGFHVGDGIALEDRAGHGFEVTTATLAERLGPATFRLSQPAESDYLLARQAEVKRSCSIVGGWNIERAAVEGITVEGNFGQPGSEYLGGCRGAGLYLAGCQNVTIRNCTVRKYNGDAISFQKSCQKITIVDCLCEENANVGLHPGSDSHTSVVRNNILRKNGYVGLFVCVGVKHVLFEGNEIVDNRGCGISIGLNDTDNLFRRNRVIDNAETAVLVRRDSKQLADGAHRNVFEGNLFRDNLGPRPAKSNSRPDSAGQAAVVIEGAHQDLVFRDNDIQFTQPHAGPAILHDPTVLNLQLRDNRLTNLQQTTRQRTDVTP